MKKLEIQIPEGKEIDWEASAKQKQIVFKDKQLTYKDVCEKLFENGYCYILSDGSIEEGGCVNSCCAEPTNGSTKHQLECILAKNKLANVAVYLNNRWKPNLKSDYGYGISPVYDNTLLIDVCTVSCPFSSGKVIFKSKELAQQAIEILGEETVKLALMPLY